MGRPIKKKYFGDPAGGGVGGEVVSSITVAGTNNNYTSYPTLALDAPTIPGGVQATAIVDSVGVAVVAVAAGGTGYTNGDVLTLVGLGAGTSATLTVTNAVLGVIQAGGVSITTAGVYTSITDLTALAVTGPGNDDATFNITGMKINTVTVTAGGSGYTSVPVVADTPDGNATLTAVLTTTTANAIAISAFVPVADGGSSAVVGDIVKQEASRRYLVRTAQGLGQCALVAAAPAAGQMTMTATDSAGGTYYVTKLTANLAYLVKGDRTGTQFASGTLVKWVFEAAPVLNYSVVIAST